MKSRCKKAAQLLTTDSPVALIGESMGFEDQHVFSRAFKKNWGVSPALYRKKSQYMLSLLSEGL